MLFRLVALRQLTARPARSALCVLGIALGVALVLAIQVINRSSLAALRTTVETTAGRAALQVVAPSDAGLPEEILGLLGDAPEVTVAAPVIEGLAFVADAQGESLSIFGIDLANDGAVRAYEGVARDADAVIDDPLVFLAQPDSVVVTRALASARGLGLDDRLRVRTPSGPRTLTVRGLLEPTGVARAYGPSLAVMDVYAAQILLGRQRRFDRIDLVLEEDADVEAVRVAIARRLPDGLEVVRPAQRGEEVERMLRAFQAMLSNISLVGLMIAVFVIYNSFATVVVERRRETGILRALGVRRREVAALYLTEALATGVVGALVGCGLGLGLARVLLGAVARSAEVALSLPLGKPALELSGTSVVVAVGAGLVAIGLAAVIPARTAARVPVVEAIRLRYPPLAPGWYRIPLAVGVTLAALSIAAIVGARMLGRLELAYVSNVALLAALAMLSVPAVRLLSVVIRPLGGRLIGTCGMLARDASERMPLRTATTVAGLALGLALATSFSVLAHSFEGSVRQWIRTWADRDFSVRSSARERGLVFAPLPGSLGGELQRVPGVARVSTFRMLRQRYQGEMVTIASDDRLPARPKGVVVSDNFARRFRIGRDDRLSLDTPGGRRRFTVLGIERNYNSDRGTVTLSAGTLHRLWEDGRVTEFSVELVPGADPQAVRVEIQRRLGPPFGIEVLSPKAAEEDILAGVDRAFAFTWALEAVTLLVAFLGIADTVLASMLARRREIGVLRAIGFRRREIAVIFGLEGFYIGSLGATLGVGAGLALAATWAFLLMPDALGYVVDLHVPAGRLLLVGVAALGVAGAAAIAPARRAARLEVATALAVE